MNVTIGNLVDLAGKMGPGAAFLLIIAIVTLIRGQWAPGWVVKEKDEEIEYWRHIAERSTQNTGSALEVAKK